MKIRLKNLGILKHAEFSLGDLTIICGENNTGKTYTAYALYGFLNSWRDYIRVSVSDVYVQKLLTDGVIKIGLAEFVEQADQILMEACRRYTEGLDGIFAAPEGRFRDGEFHIQIEKPDILDQEFDREIGLPNEGFFTYSMKKGSEELRIALAVNTEQESRFDHEFARAVIRFIIQEVIFSNSFPTPFISSTERTGVVIFRKELNFARNRLLDEMARSDKNVSPRELLSRTYQSYPRPIEENVDFIRKLEDTIKRKSFIANVHPELLKDFADIIGGDYEIAHNDQLQFAPTGAEIKLGMDQSSSSVRSLLDIGFYLRCAAQDGHLLMVDEPELNLHPANQRRIARLFARLVNLGIRVFITTHSDYIVKELNTLIMLNNDKPHLKRIADENGYRESELICSDRIKVYMTQEVPIKLEEGQGGHTTGYTLVPAQIDQELGIEAPSFDQTIDDMNKILEDIVWGAE